MEDKEEIKLLELELSRMGRNDLQELKRLLKIKCSGKNKQSIIEGIIKAIEEYDVGLEEVQEKIKDIQGKKYQKSDKLNFEKFFGYIRDLIDLWKKDLEIKIKEISEKLDKLDARVSSLESRTNELSSSLDLKKFDYPKEFKKLEKALRGMDPELKKIEDYVSTLKRLEVLNLDIGTLLKLGLMIVISNELSSLVKPFSREKMLERFYNVIKEEGGNFIEPDGTLIVSRIKNFICEKMGITQEEFKHFLGECFEKGWLTLDIRSPISGANEEDFVEVNGRKYYIIRSFRK